MREDTVNVTMRVNEKLLKNLLAIDSVEKFNRITGRRGKRIHSGERICSLFYRDVQCDYL